MKFTARGPSTARPVVRAAALLFATFSGPATASAGLVSGAAQATSATADTSMETIVVSGERAGLSVTLFDNLDLEKDRGSTGVEEVLRRAPNINVLGTTNGFINIRGENAEGAGNSALGIIPGRLIPTPFTVDGRPLAYGEITFGTSSIYDVESIEVVRGPQTTGGGVNGAIGALNVVTRDPNADFEAEFQAEGGRLISTRWPVWCLENSFPTHSRRASSSTTTGEIPTWTTPIQSFRSTNSLSSNS
ncbi:MAG: TonB-dependent receptor plug domain-containing protein [Pseudomonadota bacterium]